MIPASSVLQRPDDSRLLVVDEHGRLLHDGRARLDRHLRPGDLLVANDAATIPASLGGTHRPSGRPIEVRLAGRRSLDGAAVDTFTAVVFGAGDHRTRTEHRAAPPALDPGDRLELAPHGIRVVALDPGDMDTPLHALAVPDADRSTLKDPREAAAEILGLLGRLARERAA